MPNFIRSLAGNCGAFLFSGICFAALGHLLRVIGHWSFGLSPFSFVLSPLLRGIGAFAARHWVICCASLGPLLRVIGSFAARHWVICCAAFLLCPLSFLLWPFSFLLCPLLRVIGSFAPTLHYLIFNIRCSIFTQSTTHSINHPLNQPLTQSTTHPINHSLNQLPTKKRTARAALPSTKYINH